MTILKIAALVPMRHHSVRVPGKNYRLLAGRPLFHHILQALLDFFNQFFVLSCICNHSVV